MLLVSILTKDFIRLTSEKRDPDSLMEMLESIFIRNKHMYIILEPGLDINLFFEQLTIRHSTNIYAEKIKRWSVILKQLKDEKRIMANLNEDILEAAKPRYQKSNITFLSLSLAERVFSLSKTAYKKNHSLYDIPNFGKNIDFVYNGILKFFEESKENKFIKPTSNNELEWKILKEKVFFKYLSPFFVFYDTFIIWDRFLSHPDSLEPNKFPAGLSAEFSSKSKELKNFILIVDNPFELNENSERDPEDINYDLLTWKKDLLTFFGPEVDIKIFLTKPGALSEIHQRYYAWTSFGENIYDLSFEELLDDVSMVVSPDSGDKCMNYEGNKGYLLSLNPLSKESFRTALTNINTRKKPVLFNDYTINKYRNKKFSNPYSGNQLVTS